MSKLVQPTRADTLGQVLLQALGLSEQYPARRIIVDCEAGSVVMVYIECFASNEILDVSWAENLRGAQIQILDKGEAKVDEDLGKESVAVQDTETA